MKGCLPRFLILCAVLVFSGWAAWSIAYPTIYLRYRLSIDVETDGKVETQSSVIEVAYDIIPDSFMYLGSYSFRGRLHSSATTIDLGKRGLLFFINLPPSLRIRPAAPFGAKDFYERFAREHVPLGNLPLEAYGFPADGAPSRMEPIIRQLAQERRTVNVPISMLPMLVRFRDIKDSTTIEELDPAGLPMEGVKILGARLEVTRDPVSPRPESWPQWLVKSKTARMALPSPIPKGVHLLALGAFRGE